MFLMVIFFFFLAACLLENEGHTMWTDDLDQGLKC